MELSIQLAKYGAILMVAAIIYLFLDVVILGKRLAEHPKTGAKGILHRKKRNLNLIVFLFLPLAVVCIEAAVRLSNHERQNPHLFHIHLGLVGLFLLLFLGMRFYFTGYRFRTVHRWLLCPTICSFIGVLLTGSILLYEL